MAADVFSDVEDIERFIGSPDAFSHYSILKIEFTAQ